MTIALSQGAICKLCKYIAFNINFQALLEILMKLYGPCSKHIVQQFWSAR